MGSLVPLVAGSNFYSQLVLAFFALFALFASLR